MRWRVVTWILVVGIVVALANLAFGAERIYHSFGDIGPGNHESDWLWCDYDSEIAVLGELVGVAVIHVEPFAEVPMSLGVMSLPAFTHDTHMPHWVKVTIEVTRDSRIGSAWVAIVPYLGDRPPLSVEPRQQSLTTEIM